MKQIAVITGASSGMGKEFVRQLAESRSRLDVIVKTVAGLAERTDILGLLVDIRPAQE